MSVSKEELKNKGTIVEASLEAEVVALRATRELLEEQLLVATTALERLSRLGNGAVVGNSEGNCIAVAALHDILDLGTK